MKEPLDSSLRTGSRREFLWKGGGGLGGIALASLLQKAGTLEAAKRPSPLALRPSPEAAPAQRVIQIFCLEA
ncbi:hypothetical protein [Verrucomicrobium spinosum]|uniref:hypothetical protein n=1 Tax=Verrucomicrobium spinosum TaxID=2736 RepID=UPI000A79A761|nr:hypothetical protein [Verrucomicrobium spinosum]